MTELPKKIHKNLTICHYGESLDWLGNPIFNKWGTYKIYTKKHDLDLSHNGFELTQNGIALSNTGRESHAYIFHICQNYFQLKDLEYFTQANPSEHCEWEKFWNFLKNSESEFFQCSFDNAAFESRNGYVCPHMKKSGFETRQIWDMLFDYEPPEVVEIRAYGIFKVPKENILQHPLEKYKMLLDLFQDNEKDNKNAWNLEYFWPLLFYKRN